MKQILKYPVGTQGFRQIIKGKFDKFLSIQEQDGVVCAWFEINDDNPEISLEIISVGTGWPLPDGFCDKREYIGTVQCRDGYVWHYYMC